VSLAAELVLKIGTPCQPPSARHVGVSWNGCIFDHERDGLARCVQCAFEFVAFFRSEQPWADRIGQDIKLDHYGGLKYVAVSKNGA